MSKKTPLEMAAFVAAALVIAIVANGFASRQRRLILPGFYPNAMTVPKRVAPTPYKHPAATATTTMEASPGPGQPEMTITTPTTTAATGTAPAAATATAPVTATAAQVATATAPQAASAPAPAQQQPAPAPAADPLARFAPHPDQPFIEISGEDAALLHSRGALFLDARRTSVFEAGHIAGARSFSVWESDIDEKVNALYNERSDPREQNLPIVIYCSGGACEDSHMLSQKLWGVQFNNVYVYKDGFPDWQKRGGAVRTGGQP